MQASAISLVALMSLATFGVASTPLEGTLLTMEIEDDFVPETLEEETLEHLVDRKSSVTDFASTTFSQESGLLGLVWVEELKPNQPLALWGVGGRIAPLHRALEHALGSDPVKSMALSLGRMGNRPAYRESLSINVDGLEFIGELLLIGGRDERIAVIVVAQDGEAPQTSEARSLLESARYNQAPFIETMKLSQPLEGEMLVQKRNRLVDLSFGNQ